jgi:hypothetical protein
VGSVSNGLYSLRRAIKEVIRPDEEKFLDLANCVFIVTEEVPIKG